MMKDYVFQLKIALKGIRPPIWRRVLVPAEITFHELHRIIQTVMGWENDHLYAFSAGNVRIELPEPGMKHLYGAVHAEKTKLFEHLNAEKQKCMYVYDFGDNWVHTVTLEKVLAKESDKDYPVCIKGKRTCPPEDCGGVWGYVNMLDVLQDKSHPEHEGMLEWMGEDFDTEAFDVDEVNREMRR